MYPKMPCLASTPSYMELQPNVGQLILTYMEHETCMCCQLLCQLMIGSLPTPCPYSRSSLYINGIVNSKLDVVCHFWCNNRET